MQVHKEMIDKIPNALPNRNSVDIEIYGMQGIPEEDVREHEKSRGNDSGSYIPPPSAHKPLGTTTALLAGGGGLLPSSIPSGPQIPYPGMPLLPPGLPPGLPSGLPPLPPGAPPPGMVGHFPPPAISINLPRKPLFPSASAISASQSAIPVPNPGHLAAATPILSAPASISRPSSSSIPPPTTSSASAAPSISSSSSATISTGNPMSRIIHPGQDISLEELRAQQPKYQMIKPEPTGPLPGHLPPMPPGLMAGLPTGPPPGFHIPPPGFNGPPPPLPGRRWDAPPPSQPTFQSTFKPAY